MAVRFYQIQNLQKYYVHHPFDLLVLNSLETGFPQVLAQDHVLIFDSLKALAHLIAFYLFLQDFVGIKYRS
jgi:hypothetical protein